jgi:hypothetical protein
MSEVLMKTVVDCATGEVKHNVIRMLQHSQHKRLQKRLLPQKKRHSKNQQRQNW